MHRVTQMHASDVAVARIEFAVGFSAAAPYNAVVAANLAHSRHVD